MIFDKDKNEEKIDLQKLHVFREKKRIKDLLDKKLK